MIIIPILVILWALMDGFQHEGKKLTASIFKTLLLVGIAYIFLLDFAWKDIIYFALCWWILFDPIYNNIRGKGLFYVGTTKWTDILLRKIFRTNAPHFSFITKVMALAAAIGIIIRL